MNTNYFTGFDHILGNDELSERLEDFIDSLPHGSGINCEWSGHMPKNGRYVYLTNSFHVMNDAGFYVGYQDFTVRIDKEDFIQFIENHGARWQAVESMKRDFKLQFNGSHYLADYYMLRDYLEDTIHYGLDCIQQQLNN